MSFIYLSFTYFICLRWILNDNSFFEVISRIIFIIFARTLSKWYKYWSRISGITGNKISGNIIRDYSRFFQNVINFLYVMKNSYCKSRLVQEGISLASTFICNEVAIIARLCMKSFINSEAYALNYMCVLHRSFISLIPFFLYAKMEYMNPDVIVIYTTTMRTRLQLKQAGGADSNDKNRCERQYSQENNGCRHFQYLFGIHLNHPCS